MNETRRNIRAYKAALPGLRERVVAVALLLAMSVAMMTSATFAWITLSRAPEVSNVTTTVAANGNLEIALAKPDGAQPGESQIGDSSATDGQTIVNANLTWGNLVNLSDASYGLGSIVLRPALLGNTNNLLKQPLKGVDYGEDGRIQQYYNEAFEFTNWTTKADGSGYFEYSEVPKYGVRAISTVEYTYVDNKSFQFNQLMNKVSGIEGYVRDSYEAITKNTANIKSLAGLIGDFMTDNLNGSDTDVSAYVKDVYHMLRDLYKVMVGDESLLYCFEDQLVELANAQVFLKYGPDGYVPHTYTKETFFAATANELKANGVEIACLSKYITLRNGIYNILYGTNSETNDSIYDFYRVVYPYLVEGTNEADEDRDSGAVVLRSAIMPYINKMVDIGTTEITYDGKTRTVNQLSGSKSEAVGLLGKEADAVITKGYLKDFEQLTGGRLNAKNVVVKATYIVTVSVTAKTITTAASEPFLFDSDVQTTKDKAASDLGDYTAVAQDTYGMALDFWVRTNHNDSYLILEGNVLTKEVQENETGIDKNGNVVDLYTVTITTTVTDENNATTQVSSEAAVYKLNENGTDVWYYADHHSLLYNEDGTAPEGQTISTPVQRIKITYPVIGYEGENRIWQDNALMDVDSTTQGNGSCYVFYADDPAQQTNSLRLLKNLRVAFIDNNPNSATVGKMVAVGKLDIDNRYEESGKVTIPLVLFNDGTSFLTKTDDGLAILRLPRNESVRLTAVVYLDGREISNSDVLAANDIQGQLNIQFGSTAEMDPIDDEDLQLATRSVSAVVKAHGAASYPDSNNGPRYDENGTLISDPDVTYSFDNATVDNPMTVNVRAKVIGEPATNVKAFFMRKVNETQGSREAEFTLTESATERGVYEGSYTFTAPGEYVLRTVRLDGVDYDLPSTNYPRVLVTGFTIQDVQMYYNDDRVEGARSILTDKSSISTDLELQFATSRSMPSSVKLQLVKDDGTMVTVPLNYNSTSLKWRGSTSFSSSGVYTLKYVIMDGEYEELDPRYQKKLDLTLGMTVRVIDGGDYRLTTHDGTPITVPMYVRIYDDTGAEVKYLSGVKLYYTMNGSQISGNNPDVRWNASEGCYVGNLLIPGPSIYTFNSVSVGGNTLTRTVNTPPTFTRMSPNPPEYVGAKSLEGKDYLLSTGKETYSLSVYLKEASSATVKAVMSNGTRILGTGDTDLITGITTVRFELPKAVGTNYQSGDWAIERLELVNVYDADSNFYDDSNPMVMDLNSNDDGLHVKVVNMKIEITGENEDFTGSFMETKTTKPITIKITDQNGQKLNFALSNITLQYILEENSWVTKGGYTASHLAGYSINRTISSSDGMTFTVTGLELPYAGIYKPNKLDFTVGTEAFSYDSRTLVENMGVPVYTLTTTVPSAKITAISPTGSINTKITWKTDWKGTPTFTAGDPKTNSFTNYEATLYASATVDNSSGVSNRHGFFAEPSLTITVSDAAADYAVKLVLPAGSSSEVNFERTGSGAIAKEIGKTTTIKTWGLGGRHYLEGYTGHGDVTITTMTLTKDGKVYTVTLRNPLVIHNPSSVNQT